MQYSAAIQDSSRTSFFFYDMSKGLQRISCKKAGYKNVRNTSDFAYKKICVNVLKSLRVGTPLTAQIIVAANEFYVSVFPPWQ